MKKVVIIFVAVSVFVMNGTAFAQQNYHFFPVRPAYISKTYTDVGVLMSYSVGNDTAGLAIRNTKNHLDQFFLATPNKINGKPFDPYSCGKPGNCVPKQIHLGKTTVRVTYWLQKAPWGSFVKVSSSIASNI